ncbi:TPA: flavodoxin family protein [Candidatus Micrarchaeota archaeon]|nr:flavodoxin family protein [Candidatus Micrarchaeota archaeon]
MRILAISGSPRKGNAERLIEEAIKGANESGANRTIDFVPLRTLSFTGCCGWDECYYKGECRINDQMKRTVYPKLLSADGFLFATPNYFNNMSGLMKNFFDRTNPFALKKRLSGKKAAIIVVGGQKDSSLRKCEGTIREFCRIHEIKVVGSARITADRIGDAEKNKKAMKKCKELGKRLAKHI